MTKHTENDHSSKEALSDIFKEESFEGRVHDLWSKYRSYIQIGIITLIAAVIGVQAVKIFQDYQVSRLQKQFLIAKTEGKEEDFAMKYPREPLAGLVWLNMGDKSFEEKDFQNALIYYTNAQKAFKETAIKGRARIGAAMANLMNNNSAQGISELIAIANDKSIKEVLRAEAFYQLAVLALEKDNVSESVNYLKKISALPNSGFWAQKATFLSLSNTKLAEALKYQNETF